MGTRSLTIITEQWATHEPKELAVVYRQFDGYPEGQGAVLASLLDGLTVTNGLDMSGAKSANGGEDFAALVVWHMKNDQQRQLKRQHKWSRTSTYPNPSYGKGYWPAGNVYLMPAGTRNAWEEYRYEFLFTHSSTGELGYAMNDECRLWLKLVSVHGEKYGGDEVLFDGPFTEFKSWLTAYKRKQAAEARAADKKAKADAVPLGS
jgi:hypothetical protein